MLIDTIIESRYATFFKNMFSMKDTYSTSNKEIKSSSEQFSLTEIIEQPQKDENSEIPIRGRDQRFRSPLVMILLYASWMIRSSCHKHMHHVM